VYVQVTVQLFVVKNEHWQNSIASVNIQEAFVSIFKKTLDLIMELVINMGK